MNIVRDNTNDLGNVFTGLGPSCNDGTHQAASAASLPYSRRRIEGLAFRSGSSENGIPSRLDKVQRYLMIVKPNCKSSVLAASDRAESQS